tara:strand:+ start:441 stop:908 length:468 start_codon:yes stop_codon:yes gene_type:complete
MVITNNNNNKMNTINNLRKTMQYRLPNLPTEIWDKISDASWKAAMEIVDRHKSQLQPVLYDIRDLFGMTTNTLPSQTACDCCKEQCTEMLSPDSNGGYGSFQDMTKYGVCEDCMCQLWEQHLSEQEEAIPYGEPGHDESWDEFIDELYDGVYFMY